MRFVLPLVALCTLSSAPLRADMFNVTLSGDLSGIGTFTTDGVCPICTPGDGLLSLTINIQIDTFDLSDINSVGTSFTRPGLLDYDGFAIGRPFVHLIMDNGHWDLIEPPPVQFEGSYTVTPVVPEPSSLSLLMPIVALLGLRWRHQRHRT